MRKKIKVKKTFFFLQLSCCAVVHPSPPPPPVTPPDTQLKNCKDKQYYSGISWYSCFQCYLGMIWCLRHSFWCLRSFLLNRSILVNTFFRHFFIMLIDQPINLILCLLLGSIFIFKFFSWIHSPVFWKFQWGCFVSKIRGDIRKINFYHWWHFLIPFYLKYK